MSRIEAKKSSAQNWDTWSRSRHRRTCDRLLRTDFRDISTDGSRVAPIREVIAKCFWHNRIIITIGSKT